MSHASLIERITRSLAYMLRHKPEEFDLQLDREGYADLNEVVQALNERLGEPIEAEDVQTAIESGDRQRYEIRSDEIRALYGHSIDVDPGQPSKPPELLYVGLGSRDAERAGRYGLNGGRRRFLHLALNEDDALEMGRRLARDYVVITVHTLDAWEEDIDFYDRRSIYLSGPIPKEFLEIGDAHHDGEDPRERGDGGRRRTSGRSDRRGGGGRGGRGGREDRDSRPARDSGGSRDGDREDSRERRPVRDSGGRDDRDRDRDQDRPVRGGRDQDRPDRGREADRRPERPERPARPERPERPARPERPERPERSEQPERREKVEAAVAPARASAGAEKPDMGFGDGIFEGSKSSAPKKASKPASAPRKEQPTAPPVESAPPAEDPGPSFGAGL